MATAGGGAKSLKSLENFSQQNQEVTHTFYREVFSNKINRLDGIVNVVVQNGAEQYAELYTLRTAYKGADPIVVQSAYSIHSSRAEPL